MSIDSSLVLHLTAISIFIMSHIPGDRATCPRDGTFLRPPLAVLDGITRSFAGDTEGCCVGEALRGGAAAGGRVVLGRAGVPHTTTEIVLRSKAT